MISEHDILSKGLECLIAGLGKEDAMRFMELAMNGSECVSRKHGQFDNMTIEELKEDINRFFDAHPESGMNPRCKSI